MPEPIGPAIIAFLGAVGKLATFEPFKKQLFQQNDRAAAQLQGVLAELTRMLTTFMDAYATFYAVTLYNGMPKTDLRREKKRLTQLASPKFKVELEAGKSACGKIYNIYHNNLRGFFKKLLNPQEAEELEHVFSALAGADNEMERALEELADSLRARANEVLDLVQRDDLDGANAKIINSKKESDVLLVEIEKRYEDLRKYERRAIGLGVV